MTFILPAIGRQAGGHSDIFLLEETHHHHIRLSTLSDKETFDGPVVNHWLEQKIAQTENAPTMQDRLAMQEDPNLYS